VQSEKGFLCCRLALSPAEGAYQYPLLIKRLLMSGARYEKTREIVYRDQLRYSYPT
jgi:fatty-acyl-CoA synthase